MRIFSEKNQQHVFDATLSTFHSSKLKKPVWAELELKNKLDIVAPNNNIFETSNITTLIYLWVPFML